MEEIETAIDIKGDEEADGFSFSTGAIIIIAFGGIMTLLFAIVICKTRCFTRPFFADKGKVIIEEKKVNEK